MTVRGWPSGALEGVRRILAVRLDAMGDVLMTTPALRAVRRRVPDAHLALLTSPAGAAVAKLLPEIDEVIVYDAPWMKATSAHRDQRLDLEFIEWLRAQRFDAALIFTVNSQSPLPAATLLYLAGIPLRAAHCRENPYQLLTHWVPEPEPDLPVRHEVRRQLDLAAELGCPAADDHLSLRVPPADSRRVRADLGALGLGGPRPAAPWAVIHPGASAPSRRYPPDRFAAAADLLVDAGWRIVLTGGSGDRELVDAVSRAMRDPVDRFLPGSVGELAALLSMAPVLIGNNAGPAHVAAAVGTPVVVTYALTNPQHTPWGVPARVLSHDVPCRNCRKSVCPMLHHLCLRGVPPEAVAAAARELVGTTLPSAQWTRSSISSKRPSPASAIGTRLASAPTTAASGTGASASSNGAAASRHGASARSASTPATGS